MIENSIYSMVDDLVTKKFGSESRTALQLLYGYAKLISMDKGVLNVLFGNEEERRELAAITKMFEDREVDVGLLKQAAPLLSKNRESEKNSELEQKLKALGKEEKQYSSLYILELILSEKSRDLDLIKKGSSMDEIFAYIDQSKNVIDSQKESQSKSTEKGSKEEYSKSDDKESESLEEEEHKTKEDSVKIKRVKFQKLIEDTEELFERLMCKVMGQNEAVRMFAQGYFQSEVLQEEETDKKGPSTSFLFAGPPGVGKTFLASTSAEILGIPFLRIDMSEYTNEVAVQKLTGVPKTYAAPQPGILTKFVKDNLRCMVLLDEIEKAHENVIYQFLQVLDGGILTDSFTGESVSFCNTILIFTTNVGKSLYEDKDRQNLAALPKTVILRAIEEEKNEYGKPKLPAAICSRFASGNLIMFNHLTVHSLINIVNDRFISYAGKIKNEYDFEVDIDEKLASVLLFSQSMNMDARNISAQSIILLKNELYEFGRHIPNLRSTLSNLKKLYFRVNITEKDKTIQGLFVNEEMSDVVYLGEENDFANVPFSEKCRIFYAKNSEEVKKMIVNQDISFVVIDPFYGMTDEDSVYLSLDDRDSEGIKAFEEITEKFPQIPVYLLENNIIDNEDKSLFLERGGRDFIRFDNPAEFSNRIVQICNMLYLQKKVEELSGRGRVLSYNTAQKISKDGLEAELIYYDFRIKLAAGAEENRLLLSDEERPTEKFADVIGAENAKSELQYFVHYMKNPKKYMANSIKPPKGILLYGPPGTGKTMLARAMAGESDVSFFPTTAAEFQNKYIGEGEQKIRRLFQTAKKFAPSIIFIDEIDAIGKERTGSTSTHHTETLLNTLLTEMDGFQVDMSRPVFVVAATNYDLDGTTSGKAAKMDSALIRRFDNRIYVDLPNEKERELFLKQQVRKSHNDVITDNAIHNIAQRTTGESLAILKNVLELALRNAGKEGKKADDTYLLNALEEYMYGEKKEWNSEYYKAVSVHESGHAYICSQSGEKPSFVTIVSRGNFGGYMQHENDEQTPSYTKDDLLWKIRTSLAGRAAELEFFGEKDGINTGVSSDFQNATSLAMSMICRYAMLDDYMVSLAPETVLNTRKAEYLLEKTNEILKQQMEITRGMVREGKSKIQALSEYLLKYNQATQEDIIRIFENDS